MTRAIAAAALASTPVLLALAAGCQAPEREIHSDTSTPPPPTRTDSAAALHEGLIYGRVTTTDGASYEGRLRWGGDEEALWGNYFNGFKDNNLWVTFAPPDRLPNERHSIQILGLKIAGWKRTIDLGRPFMARFGDIARVEPRGRDVRVTLKSGTVFDLNRFAADDLADGVRVWESGGAVVDLGERQIRAIEFLSATAHGQAPLPLHGTVRTRSGDFTGFIQWNREECVGTDQLDGYTANGLIGLRFDDIRSIARHAHDSALVSLLDGREMVLSGTREVSSGNRGIYVDDERYGRVLISWDAFERVDLSPNGTGPAYADFPPGRSLTGSVVTRSGDRFAGRLVFDLDESETTETLDAPSQGVNYTIPFGLIASIVPPHPEDRDQHATVFLHSGEKLQLESTGDLGGGNAGMLIFVDNGPAAEYVPWHDVAHVDFHRPPETYPPGDTR